MNITHQLQRIKDRHQENLKNREVKNYDHCRPHAQAAHSENVTIGYLKADRLRIKNLRRAENGLPPKASYAEI